MEQQLERTYSKAELVSTLKRLERYYSGRVRASLNTGRGDAPHWQAKQDAVHKVAENLDIILNEEREQPHTYITFELHRRWMKRHEYCDATVEKNGVTIEAVYYSPLRENNE